MNRENGVAEWALGRLVLDRIETNARAALGDEGYEAAARRGEALSRDEAIEFALSLIDSSPTPPEQAPPR